MKPLFTTATLAASLSAASPVIGGVWDSLQIHGFASQALVRTSANRFFGNSPDTSFDFTELGLNASLRPHDKVLFSGQVLVRRAGDLYDGSPSLDYALADVTALASDQGRLGVRLGRIKNPIGLYNETRDMPFTRPGIFLPQVVYYDKVRNLVLSSDGLMIYADWFGEDGDLSLTLSAGQAQVDQNVEWAYLLNDFDGNLEPNGILWTGSLWYSTTGDRLKLGLSGAVSSLRFDSDAGSPLRDGTTDFLYWVGSIQYNAEDWTLSAEYAGEPLKWRGYGPALRDRDATAEGYYLQGAYRLRPDLELMLRYEEGFANRDDRDGSGAAGMFGIPPHNMFSKIWTAGVRWDLNRHTMVRAEFQHHQGTFILSPRENPDFDRLVEDWDLFALQLSFRF